MNIQKYLKNLFHFIIALYIMLKEKIKFLSDSQLKYELSKNKRFKNIHDGKRCFILGNGPSLKTENLKLLENEYVFSVNQIARHPDFEYIKPNYHFWADPLFFDINKDKPEDLELLDTMKNVKTYSNSPICFFPIQQKGFVNDFELTKDLDVYYYYSNTSFELYKNKGIDYTMQVPGFGTVVQWCITMAIYMGFSEIYLLGCDNTGLVTTIKSALKTNDDSDYGYKVTENEKKRMESLLEKQSLEVYVESYLSTLKDYRNLHNYCQKRNIKLVNCSSTTVIDSIPRDSLTNVLKKEKEC